MRERFKRPQIAVLRSLIKRGGPRPVSLKGHWREFATPLWRAGHVEIWFRFVPSEQPSMQGPYYALSVAGLRVASSFIAPLNRPARQRRAKSSEARHSPGAAPEFNHQQGTNP